MACSEPEADRPSSQLSASPARLRGVYHALRRRYTADKETRVSHLEGMREEYAKKQLSRCSTQLLGMLHRARHRIRVRGPALHPAVAWAAVAPADRARELVAASLHRGVRVAAVNVRGCWRGRGCALCMLPYWLAVWRGVGV